MSERAGNYLAEGRKAARLEDWESASLLLGRAVKMGVRDPTTLFELAKAAGNLNDGARKEALLAELAPGDRPVHGPAHLYRAVRILMAEALGPEQLGLAEQQLRYALRLNPSDRASHELLGDILFQRGDWESAALHLSTARPDIAQNTLKLSKAMQELGRPQEAISHAGTAERQARRTLRRDPADQGASLALADALAIQNKYVDAEQVMLGLFARDDQDMRVRGQMARIYLLWAESLEEGSGSSADRDSKVLQLLARAGAIDPGNFYIFDRVLSLILDGSDALKSDARELLLDHIANGVSPGLSHLILGTFLDATGELEAAEFHLQRAFELLPNAPIVGNNLAYNLVMRDEPDLPKALRLINRVLEDHPEAPAFRETRGQILVRQGEFRAALGDLEFALPYFPNEVETHRALASVYEALGVRDVAKRHAARVSELSGRD